MQFEHAPMAVLPEAREAVLAALEGNATALSGFGSKLPPRASGNGVAEIHVAGIITPNTALAKMLGGTSTSDVREQFDNAMADPNVHAIAMRYNTPGGFVEGVHELAQHIQASRGKKPIIAHVEGRAASAGYWLASSADRVYAGSSLSEVGSIGVIATHVDRSKALEGAGVRVSEVTSGKYKNAASPNAKLDETGRGELQRRVDAIHEAFSGHVAKARGIAPAAMDNVANGRVYWGAEAQKHGLIDGVAPYEKVLEQVAPRQAPKAAAKAPPADVAARARVWADAVEARTGKRPTAAEAVSFIHSLV